MKNVDGTANDSPVMKGRNARTYGQGRDSCPYPEGSPEREGWFDGFDDVTADDDAPEPQRTQTRA